MLSRRMANSHHSLSLQGRFRLTGCAHEYLRQRQMEVLAQEQPEPFALRVEAISILPFQNLIHWQLDVVPPFPISKRVVQMERSNVAD